MEKSGGEIIRVIALAAQGKPVDFTQRPDPRRRDTAAACGDSGLGAKIGTSIALGR